MVSQSAVHLESHKEKKEIILFVLHFFDLYLIMPLKFNLPLILTKITPYGFFCLKFVKIKNYDLALYFLLIE